MSRMAAYRAIWLDTWREARSRQVIRVLGGIVAVVLAFFFFSVDLHTDQGVLKGCGCAGARMPLPEGIDVGRVVNGILGIWYLGIFVAGVSTGILVLAQWVPQTFTRGNIERYLCRPLGRSEFLLARQASTFSIVAAGHVTFVLGVFAITGLKSGVYQGGFVLAATVAPLLVILAVQGYVTLVGLLTESIPVAGITGTLVFVFGWLIQVMKDRADFLPPEGHALYKAVLAALWSVLPRVDSLIGVGQAWLRGGNPPDWGKPVVQTAAVVVGVFALSCHVFRKRDY